MSHLEFIKGQESEGGRTLPLVVGACGVVTSNMVCPKHCSEGLRIIAPKSTCFCKLKKNWKKFAQEYTNQVRCSENKFGNLHYTTECGGHNL